MRVRQGLLVSRADSPGEYRDAFGEAADAGFDYVELDTEAAFHRTRVDPATVREAAEKTVSTSSFTCRTGSTRAPLTNTSGTAPAGNWRPRWTRPSRRVPRRG